MMALLLGEVGVNFISKKSRGYYIEQVSGN
ncbi:Uncharacterised protein [Vibrio metschnikovii]|nr:Uncharacterised protein [Vibrio metschnikovii]SUP50648.1 Uncharacterised protein [Vibrio metschnikovii]